MTEATPTDTARAIIQVDDARPITDAFKLPAALRNLVAQRLSDYEARLQTLTLAQGDRLGASVAMRGGYDALDLLLHDAYNFLNGLPSWEISKTNKKALMQKYGWDRGLLGDFTDTRIEKLTLLALSIPGQIETSTFRLSSELTDRIAAQWAIVTANKPLAEGGSKEVATGAKNHALDLLELINSRVRFFYCCCSDETQHTKELSKILMQPRRDYGTLDSNPTSPTTTP